MLIHSRSNPKIKHLRQLAQRKYRQKNGAFVIEGRVLIEEALSNGWQAEQIFVREGMMLSEAALDHFALYELPAELMQYASQMSSAPDALAVFRMQDIPEDPQRASAWFVADRLQDPGNFGALCRLADALNWRGILSFGPTPDPFQSKVIRGSMGASLRLPVMQVDIPALSNYLNGGWTLVATAAEAHSLSVASPLPEKMLLALGHEGQGLHPDLRELAGMTLRIPIHARVESLNVVTAGAMLAHEYLRQHGLQEGLQEASQDTPHD